MKYLLKIMIAVLSLLLIFSCGKKASEYVKRNTEVPKDEGVKRLWQPTSDKVIVLLGYGYNNEEFVSNAIDFCATNFGLAMDGGKVALFVYPDDFGKGQQGNIMELRDKILKLDEDAPEGTSYIKGLLTMGAPENLHSVIARFQDENNGEHLFPVISLFSEDDVLSTENAADLVLDHNAVDTSVENYELKAYVNGEKVFQNALKVLCSSVTINADTDLFKVAKDIAGTSAIHHYTDRETLLKAANHFVIDE